MAMLDNVVEDEMTQEQIDEEFNKVKARVDRMLKKNIDNTEEMDNEPFLWGE